MKNLRLTTEHTNMNTTTIDVDNSTFSKDFRIEMKTGLESREIENRELGINLDIDDDELIIGDVKLTGIEIDFLVQFLQQRKD